MNIPFSEASAAMSALSTSQVADLPITSVSTDTRTVVPGDAFFALRGDNYDGHEFVEEAAAKGASCLVVERAFPSLAQVNQIVVASALDALGDLARHWRSVNRSIPLVLLVGSAGKTTTKEMAARMVGGRRRLLVTRGNLNNLVGLPRTLFDLTPGHEAAILEAGMNAPGEIRRLAEIAAPDCVVLTNITNAHVGMLGSLENLYLAKTECLRHAPAGAVFALNCDDPLSRRAGAEYGAGRRIVWFGSGPQAEIAAAAVAPMRPYGYRFELKTPGVAPETLELRVFGRHNVGNSLAAAAIATFFGVPTAEIHAAIRSFVPVGDRSHVDEIEGFYVIRDYYNASPNAVQLALESLADFHISGRRYAVLGDMLELGEFEEEYHRQIGEVAAGAGLACLFTLGNRAVQIGEAAARRGMPTEHLDDPESIAQRLREVLEPDDVVLIKGSRLMKLERVYEGLKRSQRHNR